jgi:hypothetical protein
MSLTFKLSSTFFTPSYNLISYLTFPVNDDHWDPDIGEVGDTFVADDGDEFSARVASCENMDVARGYITMRDTEAVSINV